MGIPNLFDALGHSFLHSFDLTLIDLPSVLAKLS